MLLNRLASICVIELDSARYLVGFVLKLFSSSLRPVRVERSSRREDREEKLL